ncbi:MAG: TonB-dependent receptor [Ignavibacteria bacterium]|nr:TonB-dependent receptor [Ignavibacteria bacterium]
MKKLALLTVFLLSVFLQFAYSQTITILDKETLKPVNGAQITVDGKENIYSDVLGQADLSKFKGSDKLTIQAVGYQDSYFAFSTLESANYKVYLSAKSYSTDEIIVSADRFKEKLQDVPNQVLILNSKDIQNLNTQNTGELLEKTGNVFVQKSQQEGGSPVLRGFEASRVLIVVDGVRMNNIIFRAGHLQNVLRIDQNMLDRVEVLYGPGSLMYGSDALGGVMAFYSKDPALGFLNKTYYKADAYVRYSTANEEKTGHVNFNIGLKNIAFLTSFTYSKFGDLRMGGNYDITASDAWKRYYIGGRINGRDTMLVNDKINKQSPSGYEQYDIMEKILIKQSDKVKHTFNFQYSNTGDIPRYDRLNTIGSNGNFTNAEWYYGPEQRLMGLYKLDLKNDKSFYDNAQLILAYQNIKESRNNRGWNKSGLTSRTEKVNVFTLNFDLNKKINDNEIRYGIEGTYNDLKSTAFSRNIKTGVESPASTRYPDGSNNMKSFAGYISHSWEINKNLVLSDGARFSYVTLDSKFEDTTFYKFPFKEANQKNAAVTGHIGLAVMPGDNWRFYINGSTGFRAPNADDLAKIFETVKGTSTTLGSVIVPNPDLKPEYTYTGEIGISKVFLNSIKIEGIAFATLYQNAIVTAPFKYNGSDTIIYDGEKALVSANQNAEKGSYILGYNLNLSADLTSYFSIVSTLNFTYGRIKTDSTDAALDHIPPVYGQTSFQLKLNKFRGEFSVAYNGWKHSYDYNMEGEDNFADATPFGMPSWYTLNLKAAYQFTPNLSLQVGLDNILDKNYRTFSSGINAPGRNLVLTLRGSL